MVAGCAICAVRAGLREAEVSGRSSMKKDELVDAIQKAYDKETRKAREK